MDGATVQASLVMGPGGRGHMMDQPKDGIFGALFLRADEELHK